MSKIEDDNIIEGDALTVLRTLPSSSVDCVITSPPYWQLRDYGMDGQLGLEPSFQEYIRKLCAVFDEVKRVLKKTGTCWINLSDSYASNGMHNRDFNLRWHGRKYAHDKQAASDAVRPKRSRGGLPGKTLVLIPFRFAIAMVDRGWRLRNTIIWQKPNCMPSSVRDRFTLDFEYLFFFVKSKRYYFQLQFEPHSPKSIERVQAFRRRNEHFDPLRHKTTTDPRIQTPFQVLERISRRGLSPLGRRKRCVWKIGVRGCKEAHFATFPERLVETPVKAGCPAGGVVLDPFFGTGTTGIVARKLGRRFIGIELNPEYVNLARKRLFPSSKYD